MQSKLPVLRSRRTTVSGKMTLFALLLFLLGAAVGIYSGGYVQRAVEEGGAGALSAYFSPLGGIGQSVAGRFFHNWIPAVIPALLGTSLFGWLLIPLYLAYRGFALGFSAASAAVVTGHAAPKTVFALMGADALLVIPAVFAVSALAIDASVALFRLSDGASRQRRAFLPGLLKSLALSAVLALLAAFVETYLSSHLI